MTEIEQLASASAGLRQLEMLMRISGLSSELQSSEVPLKQIDQDGRYLSESLGSDLAAMQARGWIQYVEDYDGIDGLTLQQCGRDIAHEFKTLRHNVRSRFIRLTDDLLKWLYERELNEDHPHVGSFSKSSYGPFMGLLYNDEQIERAMRRLKSEGYIEGQVLYGTVFYPRLTSRGRQIVESGLSALSPERDRAANVTNNNQVTITGSNGVNVAQQSHHVQQSSGLTFEETEKIRETITILRSVLEMYQVPGATRKQVEGDLKQVEVEITQPDASKKVVKQRLRKVGDKVADAGIQIVSGIVAAVIQRYLMGVK